MSVEPVVTLVEMTAPEIEAWLPGAIERLIAVRVAAGEPAARATSMMTSQRDASFPGGVAASGHHALAVVVDGDRAGGMWISAGPLPGSPERYVMLLDLDAPSAEVVGATLKATEHWVVNDGATRLAVNIFGEPGDDQALYEQHGFVVAATSMYKGLR